MAAPVAAAMSAKVAAGNGIAGGGATTFFGGTGAGAGFTGAGSIGGYSAGTYSGGAWLTSLGAKSAAANASSLAGVQPGAGGGTQPALLQAKDEYMGKGLAQFGDHLLGALGPILKGNAAIAQQKARKRYLERQATIAETEAVERAGQRWRLLGRVVAANTARSLANNIDAGSASVMAKNADSTGAVLRGNKADELAAATAAARFRAQADAIDPGATRLASWIGAIKTGFLGPTV